jgi:alpha-galactosidase
MKQVTEMGISREWRKEMLKIWKGNITVAELVSILKHMEACENANMRKMSSSLKPTVWCALMRQWQPRLDNWTNKSEEDKTMVIQ